MSRSIVSGAFLLLVFGCTVGAEVTEPGLYECKPTNPQFQHLESIRFDSRYADPRADFPDTNTVYVTTIEEKRVALRTEDPARWECNRLIVYGEEETL